MKEGTQTVWPPTTSIDLIALGRGLGNNHPFGSLDTHMGRNIPPLKLLIGEPKKKEVLGTGRT